MNKKIISRFILGSTLIVSLSVLTVSCYQKTKLPEKMPETPEDKLKKELNSELNKVTINYPKNETVSPSTANKNNFVFSGFDATKFEISLINISPNDRGGSVVVNFKVVDIKDKKNESDSKEITVTGFKPIPLTKEKLTELSEKIVFDYPDKSNVYPWNVDFKKIIQKNLPSNTVISNIELKNFDDLKIELSYMVVDEYDSTTSIQKSSVITDFKTSRITDYPLSNILFRNIDSFFLFDLDKLKSLRLFQELFKNGSEVTFDLSSNKILVHEKGKELNILDPKTFVEVGTLTNKYQTVHAKLLTEIEKIISEGLKNSSINFHEFLYKILTLPKEEAIKEFNDKKSALSEAEVSLKLKVNFIPGYKENIEKLINKDNFSVVYNPKTGIFVIQSGEGEIDLNNPSTFKNLIGFERELKDQIMAKVKEVLVQNINSESVIDLLLKDNDFTLSYIFQKSGTELSTGFKIKHNLG